MFSIEPVINSSVVPELQSLVINNNTLKNIVVLIDLPVIDTKDGPFRLVNNGIMCLLVNISSIL